MSDGVLLCSAGLVISTSPCSQRGCQYATNLRVPDNIKQGHDIRAAGKVLENLDLALDLLLLDRLEDLDDAFLVVDNVDTLENFRVFSPACRDSWLMTQRTVRARGREAAYRSS